MQPRAREAPPTNPLVRHGHVYDEPNGNDRRKDKRISAHWVAGLLDRARPGRRARRHGLQHLRDSSPRGPEEGRREGDRRMRRPEEAEGLRGGFALPEGYRGHDGALVRCRNRRVLPLRQRTNLLIMDRVRSLRAFEWREGGARRHHQGGEPPSAQAARRVRLALHAGGLREEALRMDEEGPLHVKNRASKGVKRLEEGLARFAEQRFCFFVTKVM